MQLGFVPEKLENTWRNYTQMASICSSNYLFFRQSHVSLYLKSDSDDEGVEESDPEKIGTHSCVTLFVKKLLTLVSATSVDFYFLFF